jgi:hypothetical protein
MFSFACSQKTENTNFIQSLDLSDLVRVDKSNLAYEFVEDSEFQFKILQSGCSNCYHELESFKESDYKSDSIAFYILKDGSFTDVDYMINEKLNFHFPVFLISASEHPEIIIGDYKGKIDGDRMIIIKN